ncbi:MAG: preprotein translocase subunit SecE [Bacteroidia bacterium]|nr:preprotein translocase subunit SecE [Bacteroidia bacterium]
MNLMDIIQSISKFLKESRAEIKKVNWLARPQLISYTLMVLGFMLATGVFLGSLDWGFAFLLRKFVLGAE